MGQSPGFGHFVDDDLRLYLKEASEQVAESNEEDIDILVENVLEELKGKELKVATDAECSRMFEVILSAASDTLLLGVMERLSLRDTLFTVASNPFGSHVLEKLLARLQHAMALDEENASQVLTEIVFLVKDDLQDYIENKFATHFARRLLQLLVGDADDSPHNPRKKPASTSTKERSGLEMKLAAIEAGAGGRAAPEPPSAAADSPLLTHVRTFANVLCGPQFGSEAIMTLQRSEFAGPYLQALLRAVGFDMELSRTVFLAMLGITAAPDESVKSALKRLDVKKLTAQMKNKASSHTMEAVMAACPPDLFEPVWSALKPTFAALCLNPVANFVAQAIIAACPDGRYVSDMFHAVKGNLTDIILNRRSGVAVVLLAACAGFNVCTAEVCAAVQAAFGKNALAELVTMDTGMDLAAVADARAGKARLSTNGCLVLRYILGMPQTACRGFTDAMLALPNEQLAAIARDGAGARVVEALLKLHKEASVQGSAPKALKTKVLLKLKEHLASMANLPAASRLVEAFFVWAELSEKEVIVRAIAPRHKDLQTSKFGLGLYQVTNLEAWLRSEDEWQQRMRNSEKISAAFKKLFGEDASGKKKKRKRAEKGERGGHEQPQELEVGGHENVHAQLEGGEHEEAGSREMVRRAKKKKGEPGQGGRGEGGGRDGFTDGNERRGLGCDGEAFELGGEAVNAVMAGLGFPITNKKDKKRKLRKGSDAPMDTGAALHGDDDDRHENDGDGHDGERTSEETHPSEELVASYFPSGKGKKKARTLPQQGTADGQSNPQGPAKRDRKDRPDKKARKARLTKPSAKASGTKKVRGDRERVKKAAKVKGSSSPALPPHKLKSKKSGKRAASSE